MISKYNPLVTEENIERILSKIENDQIKRNFLYLLSKIDIRVSTDPVIVGNDFYYKIWILRKGTKKRVHIKDYYSIKLLKEKSKSPITLKEVLDIIRINAYVPDDYEEYCEIHFQDPSDPVCRLEYIDDLKRAERFKKILTYEEGKFLSSVLGALDADPKNNFYEVLKDKIKN